MSAEERKISVDGHVYRYGLVDGARCWYTGYSCKVAVDDETERLLAALSTAEREREAERHALRVALNVIDELDAYFLKPHPLDVTEYWRTSRLKYLAMRVEDAKNLAARVPSGGET